MSPMDGFTYDGLPARVIFGSGTVARLPEELDRLGASRALILSTPQQRAEAERIAGGLGTRVAGLFPGAAMHTPVEVTATAMEAVAAARADVLVAMGGGSTTGLAKAIALRTDLPQIVLPTTYAGSEMTPVVGQTEAGLKTTQRSLKVLPEVVIYDVDLTLTLPVGLSITSGINAVAHAVEALYARDRNPITSLMAEEGIRAFARALPGIVEAPTAISARSDALYGAWLCGACLGAVGMALHHKLCHTLGGSFGLPHSETHTVLLPHALAYNTRAAPEAAARVARALGVEHAAQGLHDLARRLGAPLALKDLGLSEGDLGPAADLAVKTPYWNPRPIERDAIAALLSDAFHGRRPHNPAIADAPSEDLAHA